MCEKQSNVMKLIDKKMLEGGRIDFNDKALKLTPSIMFIVQNLIIMQWRFI